MPPLLCVEHLAYRADSRTILDDVELQIDEHQIHALLGVNGSGKTTLARIVMGCAGYAPTAGMVRFSGHDLAGLRMYERAQRGIAMAWQEPVRIEGITVDEYLRLGARATLPDECLSRVGLNPAEFLQRHLDKTLSGGERKRIELASILALRPRLALLDEPAAGIDMPSLGEIAQVILELRQRGGSVLLITHVESVARIADCASYLCGGRILFTGESAAVAERYRARRCVDCDGVMCAS